MADKTEFHGDVGQAVMGDVNEAPRLKNVVQLNIGSERDKPLPITDLQRRMIYTKVKDLMTLTGQKKLDIYGIILTDFGAVNMDEFPRDRYKAAMALLDNWITEAKAEASPAAPQPPADHGTHPQAATPTCPFCAQSAKHAKDVRHMMALQSIVMVIVIAFLGWLLWQPAVAASSGDGSYCHWDGKTYSIGSSSKMMNGGIKECRAGTDGGAPYWDMPQKNSGR
jgi:hypothetical protein